MRTATAEDSVCAAVGVNGTPVAVDTAGFCSLQPAAVISTIKINAFVRVISCLLLNEVISTTRVGKGLGRSARNAFLLRTTSARVAKLAFNCDRRTHSFQKINVIHA
jgi:hypothetical protein